jgi:hypothetical protein
MPTPESNGSGKRRRELALIEIESLAQQLLADARTMAAGLEAILAEVKATRR